VITAKVLSVFVLASIKGGFMGILYWIAGVPYAALWTALSIFFAMLPVIGISLIAIPMGIGLILNGNVWEGALIIAGLLLVTTPMDTWLQPKLVQKEAKLNTALLRLGMLGGKQLGGMVGLIYGPTIKALLVDSVRVYGEGLAYLEDVPEEGGQDVGKD
jgi:predicted PurR-regulated permease PerM